MENKILGIHHITAIAGDAKKNFDFYSKILGLRFIKKTVNFDDPKTYHFYFGNETGSAGTIMTFFPWGESIQRGRKGSGMATEIGYSVPEGSLPFWQKRFENYNIIYKRPARKFGENYITFLDPDGLKLELIESKTQDSRKAWKTDEIKADTAIKGFHNVTLTVCSVKATAAILTEIFGYKLVNQEAETYRYATDAVANAAIIDLVELEEEKLGHIAGGIVHHVAFRVKNDEELLYFRNKILDYGLTITPQIDRQYFRSLYFREPGGVLFEIATDDPGFLIDESLENLGKELKLPLQHEPLRKKIEEILVPIN
jgi:glyoxalase family protein